MSSNSSLFLFRVATLSLWEIFSSIVELHMSYQLRMRIQSVMRLQLYLQKYFTMLYLAIQILRFAKHSKLQSSKSRLWVGKEKIQSTYSRKTMKMKNAKFSTLESQLDPRSTWAQNLFITCFLILKKPNS